MAVYSAYKLKLRTVQSGVELSDENMRYRLKLEVCLEVRGGVPTKGAKVLINIWRMEIRH